MNKLDYEEARELSETIVFLICSASKRSVAAMSLYLAMWVQYEEGRSDPDVKFSDFLRQLSESAARDEADKRARAS